MTLHDESKRKLDAIFRYSDELKKLETIQEFVYSIYRIYRIKIKYGTKKLSYEQKGQI